jgi:hypothetical protein
MKRRSFILHISSYSLDTKCRDCLLVTRENCLSFLASQHEPILAIPALSLPLDEMALLKKCQYDSTTKVVCQVSG